MTDVQPAIRLACDADQRGRNGYAQLLATETLVSPAAEVGSAIFALPGVGVLVKGQGCTECGRYAEHRPCPDHGAPYVTLPAGIA